MYEISMIAAVCLRPSASFADVAYEDSDFFKMASSAGAGVVPAGSFYPPHLMGPFLRWRRAMLELVGEKILEETMLRQETSM